MKIPSILGGDLSCYSVAVSTVHLLGMPSSPVGMLASGCLTKVPVEDTPLNQANKLSFVVFSVANILT